MRYSFNHVVTSLVPELLGKDALLNETVAEIERRALEEAERTSPRHARRKEVRRRSYARYRFLRGFRVFLRGRRVVYGLEWVTVSLPVMYKREGGLGWRRSCSGRRGSCSGPSSCPC
jgi:putative transposase